MMHRPMPTHMLRSACLLGALAACADDVIVSGTLNSPGHIAVLDADQGPFDEPVGYAADRHGGLIRVLALNRGGTYLESGIASFFPARGIATGRDRILGQLAAVTSDDGAVRIIAADLRHKSVFSVPHVLGRVNSHTFQYADPNASWEDERVSWVSPTLGRAAEETWTLTYTDQGSFTVVGSRSGLQPDRAFLGAPFIGDNQAISFQIDGTATAGDVITIEVTLDNGEDPTAAVGLVETELPGTPVNLSLAPDQSRLAIALHGDVTSLDWYDPATLQLTENIPLPAGAVPQRMAWTADGSAMFVATTGFSGALEIRPPSTVIEHALPWQTFDVAPLTTQDGRRLLYVAPLGEQSVWVYDLDDAKLIDVNPYTAELDGMTFQSPVQGLESVHEAYTWPFLDENEATTKGASVAVSLHEGKVVWMEEATGCLVRDPGGPRTAFRSVTNALFDLEANFVLSVDETANLAVIEEGSRHVFVNPCAGIARRERWSLTFDRNAQGWIARGDINGEQESIIYEDTRWISDNGGIHLLMQSGAVASQDAWSIEFQVLDGVLDADGDNDEDGQREVPNFDLPGEPAVFYTEIEGERRPIIAVSAQAGDIVARIDATTGEIDSLWD